MYRRKRERKKVVLPPDCFLLPVLLVPHMYVHICLPNCDGASLLGRGLHLPEEQVDDHVCAYITDPPSPVADKDGRTE